MLSRIDALGQRRERVALKDEHLVYRACSLAFARSLGLDSPEQVIGKTDFDLLPNTVAREQMALDSRTMYLARADIGTITLGTCTGGGAIDQAMIVRTPVVTAGREVRGLDIRLLGMVGVPSAEEPDAGEEPPEGAAPAAGIDFRTLVNDGIQGSLIFAGGEVLFANDNAATVLGFADADELVALGRIETVFAPEELARLERAVTEERGAAGDERRAPERLTLTARTRQQRAVRLIARGAHVQWGIARATLLSFVDVALPSDVAPDLGALAVATETSCESPGSPVTPVPLAPELMPSDSLRRLRANEQRFRHYARSAADFFWELDANLVFRVVSDDIERVLGIPGDHLIGRTHRQLSDHLADASDPALWQAHLDSLDRHEPFRDFEFRWSVDGEVRVIRYSGLPLFDRERRFVGYRGVGGDVTSAVRQAEATAYHANHDALTGLVNRRHFENKVIETLESVRMRREAHALLFMDLDSFKIVNDTCGHQAGDELLRQLARLLDSLVRKSDVLARLGGDEFGVFLYKCDVAEALKLANQIRSEVESFQFLWEEKRFTIGVSIGLVIVDDRWEDSDSLFSAADSACYIAKNEGRNRVVVYREGEGNASNRKVATHWVEEIDTALASDRLQLACQKILPLHGPADGLRFEMLLRLRLPNGEIANPRAFLPAAERYGLSAALDERAVDLTLEWLAARPSGRQHGVRHVSINLASASFTDEAFAGRLIRRIERSGVAPATLCFELSETATIANLARASEFMQRLSAIGCRFGIDDFGSGLSSFAWLRELPIDFLKIDGQLVKDILDDPVDRTIVHAINDISHSMGKRTIAEFVESSRLLDAVREIGIDFAQGFHVGEPELIERAEPEPVGHLTH